MRVSIIVPAFDAARTLGECLEALAHQNYPLADFEVIVVDDGSQDGTAEVAERYPVRLLREPHRGAAGARNRGAQVAQGEFLVFTDADCAPAPDWLAQMIEALQQYPRLAGVKGAYRTRQRELVARFAQLEYEDRYCRMQKSRYIDFVDTYSAAYRRDIFLAYGGFREELPVCEDQELSFRLAEAGFPMAFRPGAIVYHQHPAGIFAYLRRKFRIAYWKAQVALAHPGKALRDSYTPQSLKVQMALAVLLGTSLALLPFWRWAGAMALAAGVGLVIVSLPFILFALRRDLVVGLWTPFLVLGRALALAGGWMAGCLGLLRAKLRELAE